jgi:HD superfamily phosphohydrolase YqeK
MTDLDKIVYIADMIEPARDYPGVERLRAMAATLPLREAFREAYAASVSRVTALGRALHPMTHDVIAAIERETGRPLSGETAARS